MDTLGLIHKQTPLQLKLNRGNLRIKHITTAFDWPIKKYGQYSFRQTRNNVTTASTVGQYKAKRRGGTIE